MLIPTKFPLSPYYLKFFGADLSHPKTENRRNLLIVNLLHRF